MEWTLGYARAHDYCPTCPFGVCAARRTPSGPNHAGTTVADLFRTMSARRLPNLVSSGLRDDEKTAPSDPVSTYDGMAPPPMLAFGPAEHRRSLSMPSKTSRSPPRAATERGGRLLPTREPRTRQCREALSGAISCIWRARAREEYSGTIVNAIEPAWRCGVLARAHSFSNMLATVLSSGASRRDRCGPFTFVAQRHQGPMQCRKNANSEWSTHHGARRPRAAPESPARHRPRRWFPAVPGRRAAAVASQGPGRGSAGLPRLRGNFGPPPRGPLPASAVSGE